MEQNNTFEGIKTCGSPSRIWLYAGLILFAQVVGYLLAEFSARVFGVRLDTYEASIPAFLLAGYICWSLLAEAGVAWAPAWRDWQANALPDLRKAAKYLAGYALVLTAMGLVLAAAYYTWGDSFYEVMKRISVPGEGQERSAKAMAAYGPRYFLLLLSTCAVAPVVEEVFFRRIAFTSFRSRRGFWYSAFWSGLLFALFHGASAPLDLPVGIYFCWVYERERRLPVNIMLHSMVNFSAILFKTLS